MSVYNISIYLVTLYFDKRLPTQLSRRLPRFKQIWKIKSKHGTSIICEILSNIIKSSWYFHHSIRILAILAIQNSQAFTSIYAFRTDLTIIFNLCLSCPFVVNEYLYIDKVFGSMRIASNTHNALETPKYTTYSTASKHFSESSGPYITCIVATCPMNQWVHESRVLYLIWSEYHSHLKCFPVLPWTTTVWYFDKMHGGHRQRKCHNHNTSVHQNLHVVNFITST